jgi:hypothetical protein
MLARYVALVMLCGVKTLPLFRVVKRHTAGLLAGLTTTEVTSVSFPVGFVCEKAIGGGSYVIEACDPVVNLR